MAISRSLLLKCLGGVAACFGTASLGIVGSGALSFGDDSPESGLKLNELLEKVGLSECTVSGTTECSINSAGLKVEQGTNKATGKSKGTSSETTGKIKVYSDGGYSNGYKFLIEGGDITLTGGSDSQTISKLEQFETYEIKEESGNWYFSRKKTSAENIRETLGLPSGCTLGNGGCSEVEVNNSNISTIKFDGLTSGQSATLNGNAKLTITKLTTSDSDFPFDYKFELKASSDSTTTLNINSKQITLQQNTATEFKINKPTTGNNITLEEAWSLENLLKKVSLSGCTVSGGTECTIGSTFNVQHNSTKEENKTKGSSSGTPGKIKVYSDTNYNKGFKFLIEDGDITLTGSGDQISKLEEFETYEIKKESDNKWYFSRKKTSAENIRETLGLPTSCTLGNGGCSEKEISTSDITSIKFDGVNSEQTPSITGNAKLTVTKLSTSDSDYPLDYKFSFKAKDSTTTTTLTLGSKQITLNTSQDKEFRIKKGTSGNNITLEEAWTKERLTEKVGLQCNGGSNDECTLKSSGTINIKFEENEKLDNKTLDTSDAGKIKIYTTNAENYNHGFKFVIEEKDISITSESDKKLEQFETYEIKKDETDSKWYLTRKSKAADGIKTALGLPDSDCNLPSSESEPSTCCNLDETKLKAINFDGKGDSEPTINNSGKVNLTITKTTETDKYPLGYKFVFDPTETVTISTTNKIAKSSKTEFKIKKGTSGNTITLEKTWTVAELGKKVGLNCQNSDKKCSFTENNINVKNEESNKIDGAKLKNSSDSSDKKLKYEEDQEGYNQGIKFTVDGGECIELTKEGEETKTLKIENSTTTYEIKEESGTWYLTKKGTTSEGGS